MEFLYQGREKGSKILFTDSLNVDVIRAAHYLNRNKLAQPLLLGSVVQIREFASAHGMNTSGLKVRNPLHNPRLFGLAKTIFEKNKGKKLSFYEVQEKIKSALWYGMALLELGQADTLIAGSIAEWQEVGRAAEIVLGKAGFSQNISSFCLLFEEKSKRYLAFADCQLNIRPSSQRLAEIAIQAARAFSKITGQEARVAMLSFSTAGSAEHELVHSVSEATLLAKEMNPGLCIDGEVQFDAAFVPHVAAQKLPDSCLEGKANVFIFPSLNAANISLHLARDLAGYKSIGPFLLGILKPVVFLPEEGSEQEIVQHALAASKL